VGQHDEREQREADCHPLPVPVAEDPEGGVRARQREQERRRADQPAGADVPLQDLRVHRDEDRRGCP